MRDPKQAATNTPSGTEPLVFRASNSLWIMLGIVTALACVWTLWASGTRLLAGSSEGLVRLLLIGGGATILCAAGTWFAWAQRREVIVDATGITVRTATGNVRDQIPWAELIDVEERRIPSQPLQITLLLHRSDGTALLIDPQQVRDTQLLSRQIKAHPAYSGIKRESKPLFPRI